MLDAIARYHKKNFSEIYKTFICVFTMLNKISQLKGMQEVSAELLLVTCNTVSFFSTLNKVHLLVNQLI